MRSIMLRAIRFYQHCISPYKRPACRFYPSCSQYAYEAILTYGACKGLWKAVKRLSRCHPFHPGGYDPL